MKAEKAHSKHTWNTPSMLSYNSPASILLLEVCIQNHQAEQEEWPRLISYNVGEKKNTCYASSWTRKQPAA